MRVCVSANNRKQNDNRYTDIDTRHDIFASSSSSSKLISSRLPHRLDKNTWILDALVRCDIPPYTVSSSLASHRIASHIIHWFEETRQFYHSPSLPLLLSIDRHLAKSISFTQVFTQLYSCKNLFYPNIHLSHRCSLRVSFYSIDLHDRSTCSQVESIQLNEVNFILFFFPFSLSLSRFHRNIKNNRSSFINNQVH